MADLRPAFREITDGWMLIDDWYDLTDRIERLAAWIGANDIKLSRDERVTVEFMIEAQIARAPLLTSRSF